MTDAHLLTILQRNEWMFAQGQCAICFGLMPGELWQWWHFKPPHANGQKRRRFHAAELGHAPECDRALLMRDLGGNPAIRVAPPDTSKL